jgi:diadenosine tetraphosphate (Ap4A) HIT family hydrolase
MCHKTSNPIDKMPKVHRRETDAGDHRKAFYILTDSDGEPSSGALLDAAPEAAAPEAAAPEAAAPSSSSAEAQLESPPPRTHGSAPQAATSTPFPTFDGNLPVRNRPRGCPSLNVLELAVKAGSRHPLFFWRDHVCTIIYDGFPKASVHLLILPNDTSYRKLAALRPTPTDVELVRYMCTIAERLIAHLRATTHPRWRFQYGFHVVPSLEHLHMHVMTLDFEASPNLKTKRHYGSFATNFFIPAALVLKTLETGQSIVSGTHHVDSLACFWCGHVCSNVPTLKEHLAHCAKRAVLDE